MGAGRMLLFMVEQVLPPVGRSGPCIMSIHNADTQQRGREENKGQRKMFTFKFSMTFLRI